MKQLLLTFLALLSVAIQAQEISGVLFDKRTGETLIAASVSIKGTTTGVQTDIDGKFSFKATQNPPYTLVFSYIGYEPYEVNITSVEQAKKPFVVRLSESTKVLKDVEIVDSRITEKQKENPLTIESMGLQQIKQTASSTFYEGLSTLKGVDMTTASLGFVVINTRGFNSTSPVRSLQLLDGCDNQAPGLNFSVGNFAGASEIDIQKVDLIVGASSPLYGPNAFNGVLAMQTKSPFYYQGLTVFLKGAERNMFDGAIRWAKAFKNKAGEDKFAFKVGFSYLRAYDWEADNYSRSAAINSVQPETNPGGYDAVNRYGDELKNAGENKYNTGRKDIATNLGLGQFHRTGYLEKDLVDYNITNIKANTSLHYKITNKIEAKLGYNFGYGTTVYQGDNRYSLRGLQIHQVRLEVSQPDKFYVRAYMTAEDAGTSYDAVFTALRMQEYVKSDNKWQQDYQKYWTDNIMNKGGALGAGPIFQLPGMPQSVYTNPSIWLNPDTNVFNTTYAQALSVLNSNPDSLKAWHNQARAFADNGRLIPGTAAYDSIKNIITSRNLNQGGTRFFDKSKMMHVQAEYKWDIKKKGQEKNWFDLTTGASFRMFFPYSLGTIFQDTFTRKYQLDSLGKPVQDINGNNIVLDSTYNKIRNWEIGAYFSATRKFSFGEGHSITPTLTVRFDRNQNFAWKRKDGTWDPIITPAFSLVYSYKGNHSVRLSYSSGVRNPTLQDQYLYYNVGRAILVGNLNGVDSVVSIPDLTSYIDKNGNRAAIDSLKFFNVDGVRPERVQTFEIGYRGLFAKKVYIDASAYVSLYKNFLGYKLGATFSDDKVFEEGTIRPFQVYRIAANAKDLVMTYGVSVGVSYYFIKNYALTGNYSWNVLNRMGSNDSIIPAFNTPEHKFNVGISGYDIKIGNQKGFGFNINYKWIQGFKFEGSPQFTGDIPTYSLLDAQISWDVQKIFTTFKLGGSNLISNRNYQAYGGPGIGRMIYGSVLLNISCDTFKSWTKKGKDKPTE